MKDFIFDWSIFENKGFEFQNMCADIFRAHQYHVRCMEKGGSDEGRDIIIYKHMPKLVEFDDSPYAWVECKSQIKGSPINLIKIKTNILYVLKEDVSYLIFMTNHKFNNEAHNLFVRYNQDARFPFKIRYIEKDELENIIRATPLVYVKYFDKNGCINDYPRIDLNQISHKIDVNSRFFDEFENIQVLIKNTSFSSKNVHIQINPDIAITERLEPFEEKSVKIDADKSQLPDNIKMVYNLDCIYIDPLNNRLKVMQLLHSNKSIYIYGGAGCGKSRLLKEIAKSLKKKIIKIDLSNDYSKSFLDYVLFTLLEIELEYLNILPEDVVITYLKNFIPTDDIPMYVSYIKHRKDINFDVLIAITTNLFSKKIQDHVLFIDNIHNFSLLDYKLLEQLNNHKHNNLLIFTARNNEIVEQNLSCYLQLLSSQQQIGVIDLDEVELNKSIQIFLDKVCANQSVKSFLSIFKNTNSFQQFIFTLKTFRIKGIIAQDDIGKIIITKKNVKLTPFDYKALYKEILEAVQVLSPNSHISEILEIGAIYGYSFPVELIETFGDNACEILDNLIAYEVLAEDSEHRNGIPFVRFDHELTRDIIYNAVLPLQKKKLHQLIIDYIENQGEGSLLYQYDQLAYHYKNVNNFIKATEFLNKEGHKRYQRCQLNEAKICFRSALELIDIIQKQNCGDLYELEADSLHQIIKLDTELYGATEISQNARSLDVLGTLLNDKYYKGIAAYYLSKYHFEVNESKVALNVLQKALDLFEDSEHSIQFAYMLNYKSILLKNNRNFEMAIKVNREAISIFKKESHWSGMSAALADLGAVYLESNRGFQTVAYWKQSLEIARRTIDSLAICNRMIDYSYILALFDCHNFEIPDLMKRAMFMAEKLFIKHSICRAKINFSNYLFFNNDNNNIEEIKQLIEEAIQISCEIHNNYLYLLCIFSYHSFKQKYPEVFNRDFNNDIEELLLCLYKDDEDCLKGGDNRIMNMTKFMLATGNADKIRFYAKNSVLNEFFQELKVKNLDEIENNNPYLRAGLFATYY